MTAVPLHSASPRSSRWRWWALGLCLLASCASAIAVVTLTCTGRVLPGRAVAGHELSGMTREEVVEFADARLRSATVTLVVDGEELRAPLAQTGVVVDPQALADAALKGSGDPIASVLSLVSLGRAQEVVVPTSIDQSAFLSFAAKADALTGRAPVPASVGLSEDGTRHVAIGGSPGQGVDRDALRERLVSAVSRLESSSISLPSSPLEARPTITQAQEAAQRADEIAATPISLTGPNETFTPEESEKAKWVKVEEKEGRLVPSVDREAVTAWVDSIVSQVDRPAINGINAVDPQGVLLRLARPGKEGRAVKNAQALREGILNALDAHSEYSGTIEWDPIAAGMEERVTPAGLAGLAYRPSPGEKWVEVNLTDSTLTVFRGQEVAYGPILINHGGVGHETVTGTYRVYLKFKAQDMGCTPEWPYCERAVPWVAYWHQSYALHGAPWVKEFGIGTDESSHGCINIPVEDAHWIHDFVEIGTVVVTHY
ncbi:L,D-transpeptidase family protein [Schaalia hyovaginalis]|uniref:L,D-transpeptidase family protein n=1 Tax=Schaalia hyovaginalis TaxID=29316 RepID=UPI001F2EC33F|nr:L,D-transpeptidase family protein [Schaalia hyovaginalis]MCF2710625.1 L,D-transpeptidase family protein [Schaalia hyovaginalis]